MVCELIQNIRYSTFSSFFLDFNAKKMFSAKKKNVLREKIILSQICYKLAHCALVTGGNHSVFYILILLNRLIVNYNYITTTYCTILTSY